MSDGARGLNELAQAILGLAKIAENQKEEFDGIRELLSRQC